MIVDEFTNLKLKYNATLKRYYNGCNYLIENPDEADKYLPKVIEFKDILNNIIHEIACKGKKMTEKEVLCGFDN